MPLSIQEIFIDGYQKVIEVHNKEVGLHAFIAIHDTTLGPALGGIRIFPYPSREEALMDVLRLAKGMTHKSALAETSYGGGKSVIIANPKTDKSETLLSAFAEAIHGLGGSYIGAEDSGSTKEDMLTLRKNTPYVAGIPTKTSSGDPGRFTAFGVYQGIKAAAKTLWGDDSLKDRRIAIQGLGSVGMKLADFLFWEQAQLIISDVDQAKIAELVSFYQATVVPPEEILFTECDILAPCAFGGIINSNTIPHLRCKAIAGAANNQLLNSSEDGVELHYKGILYAPDFIINAGGVINVAFELDEHGYNPRQAIEKISQLYGTLLQIFDASKKQNLPTSEIALQIAEHKRINGIGKKK